MQGLGFSQAAQGDLIEVDGVLAATKPLLDSASATTGGLAEAVQTLNARISDPRVDALMTHLEGVAANSDLIAGDLQFRAHEILHPDKVQDDDVGRDLGRDGEDPHHPTPLS
jgi:hypothetical protein